MGCLNNEYPLLRVTRVEESEGKKKKKKRKGSWSSAQNLGTDWASQERRRGRNSRDEGRRARGGERIYASSILTLPTGASMLLLSCRNSLCVPPPLTPTHSPLERVLGKQGHMFLKQRQRKGQEKSVPLPPWALKRCICG